MNVAVSLALAVSAILSTFMLQLGDENGNAGFVVATSLLAILGALYFVDYKKKFAESKLVGNVLTLLVVFAHLGALTRSRQEFLAFSIANILVFVEAIIFYRKKTTRICYQILTISFVKVAVGCVFQRSGLFAFLLPLYGICSFCCFSLLLLESERKYYSRNVSLSPRFDARGFRPPREENAARSARRAKKLARQAAAKRARLAESRTFSDARFALLTEPTRFSSFVGANADLGVGAEYFRRFVASSFWALGFAAFFFCFFPRIHRLEIGGLEFGRDGWTAGRSAVRATTGFAPQIELGELGPAVDNPAPMLSIRFVDVLDPKRSPAVSPNSLVYLRGVPLARYADRAWSQIDWERGRFRSRAALRSAIERTSPTDPATVLTSADERSPRVRPPRDRDFDVDRSLYRPPFFSPATMRVSTSRSIDELRSFENVGSILPPASTIESQFLYDSRSRLVGTEIVLEPLDAPVLFAVWPFYSLGGAAEYYFRGNVAARPRELADRKTTYRFATNAFRDGVQAPLTPNQDLVWPFLDQYLELNVERFPRLIELARRWDAESNLPKEDFVARARYLESKLRDVGDFQYDRDGVERNPQLDPLEDFVAEHRAGHCEYFAGALALMLRAIGVPSRTVVGFAFYPSANGGKTVVRQSDAHSWTEAFIPENKLPGPDSPAAELFPGNVPNGLPDGGDAWPQDGAWLRLDATPAGRSELATNAIADVGAQWLDFFQTIWRDYVLNFNGATQTARVYQPIVDAWKKAFATLRDFRTNFRPFASFAEKMKSIVDQARVGDWSPRAVGDALWFFGRIAFVVYLVARLVLYRRARRRGRGVDAAKKRERRADGAFAFYDRIEQELARKHETARRPSETPREFVERCFAREDRGASAPTPGEVRRLYREIVERRYRAQFGGAPTPPDETARWDAAFRQIAAARAEAASVVGAK